MPLLLLLAFVLASSTASAFHLEESLRGGTTAGHPSGGMFAADGWHVTDRTDRIWFAVPTSSAGSIEFTMSNVTNATLYADPTLGGADNDLFTLYDAAGISEPIPYRPDFVENNYKLWVRIRNEDGNRGTQKLTFALCPDSATSHNTTCPCGPGFIEETTGGDPTWDGTPQRLRVEWGHGVVRFLRNGTEVDRQDYSATGYGFGPREMHFSIGSTRALAVGYSGIPVGAIFSDLVVDTTDGAVASCSGAVVDAGAPPPAPGDVIDVPALEDVTVAPNLPSTVYPVATDLSVGAGDSEFYVKFRVPDLPGRVVGARLLLTSGRDATSAGSGASLFTAASDAWSETSLTWSARPGPRGARLARIDGVAVDQPYGFDLPAGVVSAGGGTVYAFAVLPEPSDSNAAHFDSKEVSPARGPILRLTIDRSMPPPAASDAGAPPVPADAGTLSSDASARADGGDAGRARDGAAVGPGPDGSCGCRAAGAPERGPARGASGAMALIALAAITRRARSGRRARGGSGR